MDALHSMAEAKIREAIQRGDFDDLPGRGKPLCLEDLSRVQDGLRAGYILLRSAGLLPEEVELRKELLTLRDLLRACSEAAAERELRERANACALRLDLLRDSARNPGWVDYGHKVLQRLARARGA